MGIKGCYLDRTLFCVAMFGFEDDAHTTCKARPRKVFARGGPESDQGDSKPGLLACCEHREHASPSIAFDVSLCSVTMALFAALCNDFSSRQPTRGGSLPLMLACFGTQYVQQ